MNQRNSQHRKWSCLIWGGTVGFWGFGPKHRMVLEGCSSCTESNLVLPCNLWWGKRSYYSDITVSFKRVDRIESSKKLKPMPSTAGLSEIAACPLFPTVNGSVAKNLPAVQETRIQSLGWEDPLEKEMATHCSILAWRIPGTEEPVGLPSMGSHRVGHDWRDLAAYIVYHSLLLLYEQHLLLLYYTLLSYLWT